jgi:hypothetical protein
VAAIRRYLTAYQIPRECALLRLDGQYGTGVVLSDVARFAFATRGKDYSLLDHPLIQARLHLPPDQLWQVIVQWIWNLRLELGQQLEPQPLCTTTVTLTQADEQRGTS